MDRATAILRIRDMTAEAQDNPTRKRWLKRLGFWGFMFFFVKGLLWLIVPALIAYFSLY
jgi:hypothetical protein